MRFSELREASGEFYTALMSPASKRHIRQKLEQMSDAMQHNSFIEKIEEVLQYEGYTLMLEDMDIDGDEGMEDFFIFLESTGEQVMNCFISVEWAKIGSATTFAYTNEGSKLRYDVSVELVDSTIGDMENMEFEMEDDYEEDLGDYADQDLEDE